MDSTEIAELLDDVKRSRGPEPALCVRVFRVFGITADRLASRRYVLWDDDSRRWVVLPQILRSTDDALQLVDRVRPGKIVRLSNEFQGFWRATVGLTRGPEAANPARAIVCALLTALPGGPDAEP